MKDSYRWLAPIYSSLSRLVFGRVREEAIQWAMNQKLEGKILILGGGDGLVLSPYLNECEGEYWEISPSMLHLAKHHLKQSKLSFHLGKYEGMWKPDVILLPFVLDTFPDWELEQFARQIKSVLPEEGEIRLIDFFPPVSSKHRLTLRAMIQFHRIFTAHRRKDLPDYDRYLTQNGLVCIAQKTWMNGFIQAKIYRFSNSEL